MRRRRIIKKVAIGKEVEKLQIELHGQQPIEHFLNIQRGLSRFSFETN